MHPNEDGIARTLIYLCGDAGVGRFVLYSVLHPILAGVPHHDRKLQAERYLVDSGLPFTILQPCRYMQHLVPIWKSVLATGVHSMPFSVTSKFSLVDLADLADEGHFGQRGTKEFARSADWRTEADRILAAVKSKKS